MRKDKLHPGDGNEMPPGTPPVTEVIILAGGLGTRLKSLIPDLPKCMAPVNGLPFLYYIIRQLQDNGLQHFIFSLGYQHQVVIQYLDQSFPGLIKTYVVEDQPLGTGGGIRAACSFVNTAHVLVVNGDTYFNIDIAQLANAHFKHAADCTIALKLLRKVSRYGMVQINSQSLIKSFTEKQPGATGYINGGLYLLHVNNFLNKTLPTVFSFERDWLEKKVGVSNIFGVKFNRYFIDIGVPEDYQRACLEVAQLK